MKKTAFSLMEVLIAIIIVGVIATLTIPNIYGDSASKVNMESLKSTYTQVSEALQQAMIDQGVRNILDLDFEGSTNQQKLSAFLNKYLDIANDCGNASANCFASSYLSYKGVAVNNPFSYDGKAIIEFVKLTNGVSVGLRIDFVGGNSENNVIIIDANGDKKPNAVGKDFFAEWINEDGTLGLGVYSPDNFTSLKNECMDDDDAIAAEACLTILKGKGWQIQDYLK